MIWRLDHSSPADRISQNCRSCRENCGTQYTRQHGYQFNCYIRISYNVTYDNTNIHNTKKLE